MRHVLHQILRQRIVNLSKHTCDAACASLLLVVLAEATVSC